MKVNQRGNLYATGPGGIWIISAWQARGHDHRPENHTNGDEDGKILHLTAQTGIYPDQV